MLPARAALFENVSREDVRILWISRPAQVADKQSLVLSARKLSSFDYSACLPYCRAVCPAG